MGLGRLRDHKREHTAFRASAWTALTPVILRKRADDPQSAFSSNQAVWIFSKALHDAILEQELAVLRSKRIALTSFEQHIYPLLTDEVCLSQLRFRKCDVAQLVEALAWPAARRRTARNRYFVSPLLVTCVVLRRLASPCRWKDIEVMFGRHASQLSEIFLEGLLNFTAERSELLMGDVKAEFWRPRLEKYASAIKEKSGALENVVGFIDGTVIAIARPGGDEILQRVAYNGHKRKHGIKFQAVTTPCGLAMHLAGPMEGRRHDWTLYIHSELDGTIGNVLNADGAQYVLYGDSGYSGRLFLYIPFSGSNLTSAQKAFNTAMAKSRVTVEWYFKEVKLYWTTLDFKRKMRVRESAIGACYIAGVLLTNFRNCTYPNSISQYFDCAPPSLEEYLNHRM